MCTGGFYAGHITISVHPQVTFLVITTVVVWRRQTRLKTRRPPSLMAVGHTPSFQLNQQTRFLRHVVGCAGVASLMRHRAGTEPRHVAVRAGGALTDISFFGMRGAVQTIAVQTIPLGRWIVCTHKTPPRGNCLHNGLFARVQTIQNVTKYQVSCWVLDCLHGIVCAQCTQYQVSCSALGGCCSGCRQKVKLESGSSRSAGRTA